MQKWARKSYGLALWSSSRTRRQGRIIMENSKPSSTVCAVRARFRWGEHLEFVDEAGPGDFVYVPPYVPHQELNARRDQSVEAVIVRSGQEPIVVNLDIPTPEEAPFTPQRDPFHSDL